jgi:hypothetical protein
MPHDAGVRSPDFEGSALRLITRARGEPDYHFHGLPSWPPRPSSESFTPSCSAVSYSVSLGETGGARVSTNAPPPHAVRDQGASCPQPHATV